MNEVTYETLSPLGRELVDTYGVRVDIADRAARGAIGEAAALASAIRLLQWESAGEHSRATEANDIVEILENSVAKLTRKIKKLKKIKRAARALAGA